MKIPKSNLAQFLEENKSYQLLKRGKDTTLIKLPTKESLKILDTELLERISNTGYDLETRLEEVKNLTTFHRFSLPTRMLEENGIVIAYTMPEISGVDFTDYYEDIFDLLSYAKLHSQIEDNIKVGNELGMVFPDLCTTENIRITKEGKVFFLDYDGLQIKEMPAVGYSDFLGMPKEVLTDKYYDEKSNLFSKELDVKSAIFLYFVDVFGIDLASINRLNPVTRRVVTFDDIFSIIQLEDVNIQHKVWKLFQPSIPNEFLGADLYRLAENYRLVPSSWSAEVKILVKK